MVALSPQRPLPVALPVFRPYPQTPPPLTPPSSSYNTFIMDIELNIDIKNNSSVQISEQFIKFVNANIEINQHGIKNISDNKSIHSQFHIDPANIKMMEEIGKGASSKVYRAIYQLNGKALVVAIKSICALEKKMREQILSDLNTFFNCYNCGYLVTFYGCYYEMGNINQVLEYMDLGSFRKMIQLVNNYNLKIPQPVLSCIAGQLLHGLNYIHCEKHLIHRDIKPQNILLNSQGEVKISDFGISKSTSSDGIAKTFVGTFVYMSPERVRPESTYNFLSDIWSFGLVMYELATGDNPYKMIKQKSILNKIVHLLSEEEPKLAQSFSLEFRDFLSYCICKDLTRRCSTQKLLTHEWITLYEAQPNALKEWLQGLREQNIL